MPIVYYYDGDSNLDDKFSATDLCDGTTVFQSLEGLIVHACFLIENERGEYACSVIMLWHTCNPK